MAALGSLTAMFDHASGQTHVLAEPLPQILEVLATGPADCADVAARLAENYGTPIDAASLARIDECLNELAAMGLVRAEGRAA